MIAWRNPSSWDIGHSLPAAEPLPPPCHDTRRKPLAERVPLWLDYVYRKSVIPRTPAEGGPHENPGRARAVPGRVQVLTEQALIANHSLPCQRTRSENRQSGLQG